MKLISYLFLERQAVVLGGWTRLGYFAQLLSAMNNLEGGSDMSEEMESEAVYAQLEVGWEIGDSSWILIDQSMITGFADVTLDPDPMHIDPAWAIENGPYGGTIAFGFLTLSLLTAMVRDALNKRADEQGGQGGHYLNYGIDRMRWLQPVPVNSRVRGKFKVRDNRLDDKGRNIVTFDCEVELEGADRPALVAQWLTLFMPDGGR